MAVITANGSTTATQRRRPWDLSTTTLGVAACCVLAFLYGPIVTLMVFSFNSNPVTKLPLTEFTFAWYDKALNNPDLITAV